MDSMKARIKAARDLLGMTQAELCEAAGIPLITLRRIEGKPDHAGLVSLETVRKVREVLEAQGVQFLEGGQVATGPGVALGGKE
ncbi:helix-turn-helix transcriptional regulator [Paenirhodobacter enshiensis]|uniref:DNA-binding protein n=1 Tax=Paenirhodobacter enshiensis TaxID=1105367 RepID=A0A086XSA2_9RHOB|nr:helix-turn-helix transcriptional regulator [Paenirhodobacter enshiensis]KFI24902.1 DNA-binding protein [Paenirhodobacter enshiensis]